MDAHPDVGASAEAGLPALMTHLARVWATVNVDAAPGDLEQDPGAVDAPTNIQQLHEAAPGKGDGLTEVRTIRRLPPDARLWIANTVQEVMRSYCQPRQKRIYCDKSLDSIHHLQTVAELWPQAKVILIFRHVMDTIASGLEASPWGFDAYGYGPYVQAMPGNTVAALATYWADHVMKALEWEKQFPNQCHRVRYEDLVLEPVPTVLALERFLGVEDDTSILDRAFRRDAPQGPGDYKFEYTLNIHRDSLGRGKRIPIGMIPPALLEVVNRNLGELGYGALDHAWNAGEREVDGGGRGLWATLLARLMDPAQIEDRDATLGPFAVVAEDHHELRWVVEPEHAIVRRGEGEVDAVLTGTAEDLVLALTGEENLGVLFRNGRLRHVVADADEAVRPGIMQEVQARIAVLQRATEGRTRQIPDNLLAQT